jgi:hypothetical protein
MERRVVAMTSLPSTGELAFKRVPEGFLFAPGATVLGSSLGCRLGPTYLLSEARKAEVAAVLRRYHATIRSICWAYAVACLTFAALSLSLPFIPGALPPMPKVLSLALVSAIVLGATAAPIALTFAFFALALRRALAGAPRSAQSITAADVFNAELAALSKSRIKLQISAGALIAIVSASHAIEGVIDGTLASKGVALFGLSLGLYFVTHHSVLLMAKRALKA